MLGLGLSNHLTIVLAAAPLAAWMLWRGRADLLVLVCGGLRPDDTSANGTYGRLPHGFCESVRALAEPLNVDAWIRESGEALPRIDFTGQAHPPGSWEDLVRGDYWETRNGRALQILQIAAQPSLGRYGRVAVEAFQQSVEENPEPLPHVYKNLGIALVRQGLETAEQRARAAAAFRRYLAAAPDSDPDRPLVEQDVAQLTR